MYDSGEGIFGRRTIQRIRIVDVFSQVSSLKHSIDFLCGDERRECSQNRRHASVFMLQFAMSPNVYLPEYIRNTSSKLFFFMI